MFLVFSSFQFLVPWGSTVDEQPANAFERILGAELCLRLMQGTTAKTSSTTTTTAAATTKTWKDMLTRKEMTKAFKSPKLPEKHLKKRYVKAADRNWYY